MLRSGAYRLLVRLRLGQPLTTGLACQASARGFGTAVPQTQSLDVPIVGVWGANTDVGKTLISAGLAAAVARNQGDLLYIKPVQTGYPEDSDVRMVCAAAGGQESTGEHAKELLPDGYELFKGPSAGVTGRTLYAWKQAVGPHLAVQSEGRPIGDSEIVESVLEEVGSFGGGSRPGASAPRLVLVETAGGVASPAPSGSLQCDALRPLRLPALLVGDGRLGGISATISALESLQLRGIDTVAVVLTEARGVLRPPLHRCPASDHCNSAPPQLLNSLWLGQLLRSLQGGLSNGEAVSKYLRGRVPVFTLPPCSRPEDGAVAGEPGPDPALHSWLEKTAPEMDRLLGTLLSHHHERTTRLAQMSQEARDILWWPFTQHANISNDLVTVLDSRCGDDFAVYLPPGADSAEGGSGGSGVIQAQFDACASWWTQGLGAELQPLAARELGYAAGRYGHLMFPENAHEPALQLSRQLLHGPGQGWGSRVFYSDDGSTALEVGVKMAFRKYIMDHEQQETGPADDDEGEAAPGEDLHIIGLTESYHGDTLGCMDLSGPSPFNGRMQTPWYEPRGLFLDPPTLGMVEGFWVVEMPSHYALDTDDLDTEFETLDEIFNLGSRKSHSLASIYRERINMAIERHPKRLAACVMEPVLQGAGGMRMIDPLWQALLMEACKERRLPVVLDEVFTGLWRLGRVSAAEMMGVKPDVACYAKLLTGGTIPLAATMATEEVFKAFDGPTKVESLLHGHSYTAHPMGCHIGTVALQAYTDPVLNRNYIAPGSANGSGSGIDHSAKPYSGRLAAIWDEPMVREISFNPKVRRVIAIGTVFAAELQPERGGGGGYLSSVARNVTQGLRTDGIFARPLGNVVYFMASPFTSPDRCRSLLRKLNKML